MKVIKTKKGNEIVLFADCKELTAERENELHKLSVLDLGVGNTMQSIGAHFSSLHEYISAGEMEAAAQEAINLHNNFFLALNGINISSLSLAVFVYKIDGMVRGDLTEAGIQETSNKLLQTGITSLELDELLNDLKKKLTATFTPSFLIGLEAEELTPLIG